MVRLALCLVLGIQILAPLASVQEIALVDGTFRVAHWPSGTAIPDKDLSSIFAVYTEKSVSAAMLGVYTVESNVLVFRPRFPLVSGLRYLAVLSVPGRPSVEASFDVPKKDIVPSTHVERVYPTTDVVPSNLLKLYIRFSASMSQGEAWIRIHLLDESGAPIDSPFIEQELWDSEYRTLTLLFSPGRIKRGLVPNLEVGPPLVEGRQYTLIVDRDFEDAQGNPLREAFRRTFRGGAADVTAIDPKVWRLNEPKAGTVEPLVVAFPEPLDHELLERTLSVAGVAGNVEVERGEMEWRFIPQQPWKADEYQLTVDLALEDLAGNRIDRLFDVDLSTAPSSVTRITTRRAFRTVP